MSAGSPVPDGELDVWVVDLSDDPRTWASAGDLLDPREVDRARRLVDFGDRTAYVRAHAALRQILAGYMRCHPHEVVYEYCCVVCGRPHGKPKVTSLASPRYVPFNMARSGELALVAVAAEGRVGIDTERSDTTAEMGEVTEFFAPDERAALMTADDEELWRREAVITWTRKEAYTKALGAGLSLPLDEFEVATPPDPPVVIRPAPDDSATWFMAELPLPDPYVGTVVAEGGPRRIRLARWDAADDRGALVRSGS